MQARKLLIILICIVLFVVASFLLWPYAFTVVPIAQIEEQRASEAFDPVRYVDGIWATQVIPTIEDRAANLADVLGAMRPDAQGIAAKEDLIPVAQQYGLITVGEAHVYLVKGEAEVVSVDMSSSVGVMEIQLAGYPGPIQVLMYTGPRIPSDETSVRDGVGFISFGDFREQTEFGKVGAEINRRVISQAYGSVDDKEQLVGKTITFWGAMTVRTFNLVNIDLNKVTIVPVRVEVTG